MKMKKNGNAYLKVVMIGTVLLFFSWTVKGQTVDKMQVEQQLLEEARKNIEQYRKGDAVIVFIDKNGKKLKNLQVEINQVTQDFLFGNLCEDIFDPSLTPEEMLKFKEYFTSLFNFSELNIKWNFMERNQGKPDWHFLQKKIDWCHENGVIPKGHALSWTNMSGTPEWILKLPLEQTNELAKARVYNLVAGWKKDITLWDVVNEPVTTVPWHVAMRDSVAGERLIAEGSRYDTKDIKLEEVVPWVENTLRWAYMANPQGEYMLNEFNILSKPEIRDKFYQLLVELQRRKAPLNGIGIQAHEPREMWFSPVEIVATYNQYSKLGLPLHITEFIPQSSMKKITGGWREGLWTEEAQAECAEQFYTLSFGHPAITSIHWWGLTDKIIWLEGGGLLDKNFNPKPVYHRLHKLIKEDWMTKNLQQKTRKDGKVAFRGFFGQYKVAAHTPDGRRQEFKFHLKKGGTNVWTFQLN